MRYPSPNICFAALFIFVAGTETGLAGGPQPFLERGIARGINYPVDIGFFQLGSGLGLFDIDGDGDPDALVIGAADGRVGLYENDGTGFFTDRTNDAAVARMAKHVDYSGVSAADYDADGDLDIYLSRYGAANILYRNDGNWNFTDVTAAAGLGDTGHTHATVWADTNADGWLDLYVTNRTNTLGDTIENGYYENNGDGTFTEKALAVGVQRTGDPTLVATFFDFDFDADPDLYLGTDKGAIGNFTNHLFENDGAGSFTNITAQTGTEANVDCMGIALGDIDRNGFFDMFLTNIPLGHVLLTGNPDGTFTDQSIASGAQEFEIGWGTVFFDFDNDSWEDLYITHTNASNALYRNPGSLPLDNIGLSMNVATTGSSYCMATGDIDNDGDLDLMVAKLADRIQLYINNEGSTRNWAKFDVVGQGANTFGIGTQIHVLADLAFPPQMREVRAGHNFKAMDPTTVHFGLDIATVMNEITITWPHTADTRLLTGYPANRTWTAYPPERIGDYDLDGDVDGTDRSAILDRHVTLNASAAEPIEPGIEMLDADGDADFDADDVLLIGTPCPSDVAVPLGVLDLADINTFIAAFLSLDPLADLTGEGIFDLADLSLFITGFNGGCP